MHAHTHHHHSEPGQSETGIRVLMLALFATAGFAVVELIAGWRFGSLALMSDSGHMFSDAAALGVAALAVWIARRPAGARHSYGFSRAEIVAAFVNGLALLIVVVLIFVESVRRLLDPPPVAGLGVAVVALLGLIINLAVVYLLGRGERSLNMRAATLHVLGDLIGSVAALTAGAVVYFTDWRPIDPLLSIVIGVLILASTIRLLRDAVHILMEGVPSEIRLAEVGHALAGLEGVRSVHDLHIWSIDSGQSALSAHVDIANLRRWPMILEAARRLVRERYGIGHVTLQPEALGGINAERRAVVRIVAQGDAAGKSAE
ncbi:MAG: cation diffusion facilitator family transporter [Burkholderiales bacterium]